MKSNILFISMHLPSLSVPEAGQKIVYNNLKDLSLDNNIILMSFYNDTEKSHIDKTDYSMCIESHFIEIKNSHRIINIITNLSLPSKIAYRYDKRMVKKIREILDKYDISSIHIEYEQGAQYYNEFEGIPITLVYHDIISQSICRKINVDKKNILYNIFMKISLRNIHSWEKSIIKKIKNNIVLNIKDELLLKDLDDSAYITVNYPKVNQCFYQVDKTNRSKQNILFWGAMNRKENEDAIIWFLDDMYPLIKYNFPNIKIFVVGSNPSIKLKSYSSENVIITGFVDDPIPYFEKCSVSVVPLRYGAGIKIKVLETLASGMITISTSVGAEGVEKNELLCVADDARDFAELVMSKLS